MFRPVRAARSTQLPWVPSSCPLSTTKTARTRVEEGASDSIVSARSSARRNVGMITSIGSRTGGPTTGRVLPRSSKAREPKRFLEERVGVLQPRRRVECLETTVLNDHDPVADVERRQPMGDDDDGQPAAQIAKRVSD